MVTYDNPFWITLVRSFFFLTFTRLSHRRSLRSQILSLEWPATTAELPSKVGSIAVGIAEHEVTFADLRLVPELGASSISLIAIIQEWVGSTSRSLWALRCSCCTFADKALEIEVKVPPVSQEYIAKIQVTKVESSTLCLLYKEFWHVKDWHVSPLCILEGWYLWLGLTESL